MPHVTARRTVKRAVVLLCAAFACAAAAQTMYKWVDEKGVTHFSQDPPPDGRKATKVEPKVTPPSSDVKYKDDWKAKDLEARKKRLDKDQKDEYDRGKAHNEMAESANKCNHARRQLSILARQVPLYTKNDKGERVYLEDKDRPAEVAAWQKDVDTHCR